MLNLSLIAKENVDGDVLPTRRAFVNRWRNGGCVGGGDCTDAFVRTTVHGLKGHRTQKMCYHSDNVQRWLMSLETRV